MNRDKGVTLPAVGVPRRVFLSHTGELREYPSGRSFVTAAGDAVTRAGDTIGDMAYFTARDDKPADYCQARVRDCDVYVGLIGLRYGSPVRDRPEVSYTELEFDTATEAGKPRLMFFLDEDAAVPIPPGRMLDRDLDLQARQRAFRDKVLNGGVLAAKFASPEQLEVLLLQALQALLSKAEPPSVNQPRVWRVPPRNSGFIGRDSLLTNIREALQGASTGMVVLQGPSAVGKTQLSLEYAHRFAADYDTVWVINAEQPALIISQLANLAVAMGVVTSVTDAQTAAMAAITELRTRPRWLLVFDNIDNPDDLPDFLPDRAGHVIGTTRTGVWYETASVIPVEEFSRSESITLLTSRVNGLTLADADSLASALGGLPLALAQAASVLQLLPATDFKQLLNTQATHILSQGKPRSYPAPLAASTIIAVDKLAQTDPAAANLLYLCCHLAPESIPGAWFYNVGKLDSTFFTAQVGPLPKDSWEIIQDFGKIRDIGLGWVDQAGLRLHRLTQAILCDHTADYQPVYQDLIVAVLVAAAPSDSVDPTFWPDWSRLVPHLLPAISANMPAALRPTASSAVRYLIVSGQAKAALAMAEHMQQLWVAELGPDNSDALTAAQYLAHARHDRGDYEAALELQEETLERRRRVLGNDHPDTLQSENDLAATLASLGRSGEALPLNKDTYDRRRRVLGDNHRETLQSAGNLAGTLVDLGRYKEALPLSQEAYGQTRKVLGEDHPDTVTVTSNLAGTLVVLGRYKEALPLSQEAYRKTRKVLGEDHPDTVADVNNLAQTLVELGHNKEALPFTQEAYDRARRLLGEDHPTTVTATNNLARTLFGLGHNKEALPLSQEAYDRARMVLGEDHPTTVTATNNLAQVLSRLGRRQEALPLTQEAYDRARRLLGEDHPTTVAITNNLGEILFSLGGHKEALPFIQDAYDSARRVLGANHPRTLTYAQNLVTNLETLGRRNAALHVRAQIPKGRYRRPR